MTTSQQPKKKKRQYNRFLYLVTNQFTVDEFKRFTNFREIMRAALEKNRLSEQNRLEHYIKVNFKETVPIEKNWMKGGFASLKLTDEFYTSDAATRIFHKLFRIKKCKVIIDKTEVGEEIEIDQEHSDEDGSVTEKIDLTKDDESDLIGVPKRKIIYPKKICPENYSRPSGIDLYATLNNLANEKPTSHSKSLQINISSSSSSSSLEEMVVPTDTKDKERISSKVIVLSNIQIFPLAAKPLPTTLVNNGEEKSVLFQNQSLNSIQISSAKFLAPIENIHPIIPKIGPKYEMVQAANSPTASKEATELTPNEKALETKRKIGPKSKMLQAANPPITSKKTAQLTPNENALETKRKIGPKSKMLQAANPPITSKEAAQLTPNENALETKRKIGPKSKMELSTYLLTPSKECIQAAPNKTALGTKRKIGPKSKMDDYSNITSNEKTIACSYLSPSKDAEQSNEEDSFVNQINVSHDVPIQDIRTNSRLERTPSDIPLKTFCELIRPTETNISFSCSSTATLASADDAVEGSPHPNHPSRISTSNSISLNESKTEMLPSRANHNIVTPVKSLKELSESIMLSRNALGTSIAELYIPSIEDVSTSPNKIPEDNSEATVLVRNIRRSFDNRIAKIKEQFENYVIATNPSDLSLKHFFDLVKLEEYDRVADTQLNYESIVHTSPESKQGVEILKNKSPPILTSHILANDQPFHPPVPSTNASTYCTHGLLDVKIKMEQLSEDLNESNSSDVQFIEIANDPIEILHDYTQDLMQNLLVDREEAQDQLTVSFAIPSIPDEHFLRKPAGPSTSNGFLKTLPKSNSKKRSYQALNIVKQPVYVAPVVLPDYDFSQQADSPNENYEIEECTMSVTQLERYELLNYENTIFLSSQLENYESNTGKLTNPCRTATVTNSNHPSVVKHPSPILNSAAFKRRRIDYYSSCENKIIKRELNWKVMSIKTIILKALTQKKFSVEMQVRNNFDKFYINDRDSIKRLFNVCEKQWQDIKKILDSVNGYSYDVGTLPTQESDLLHAILNCFIKSIPTFITSRFQFKEFMGHLIEITEQQPLKYKCVKSAIDSNIVQQMIKFKKNLNNKIE